MVSELDKTLALLAAGGAELEASVTAHGLPKELFDELPGETRQHENDHDRWQSKSGRVGNLTWRAYTEWRRPDNASEGHDG